MKSQSKILNWGLMSTARINRALIPALRRSRRNQLVAVASRDETRAEAYAREQAIPRYYASYAALIADPQIDAVYISLPNHLHAEWAIRAAQAGKHVLCEKPLALSLLDVDAIQAAAQQTGVVVTEAFMYRHHPQTLKVQQLVADGAIGQIKTICGSFAFTLKAPNIRLNPEWGGGCLWDVGCYPVSYAMMIAGATPAEVFGWQDNDQTDVDMTFIGQMRFANGLLAQFDCAFNLPYHTGIEIYGSEGSLLIPTPFKPDARKRVVLTRGDKAEKLFIPSYDPYLGEVDNLAEAVLDGQPPRLPLEQSRAHISTLLALFQSARENRVVQV